MSSELREKYLNEEYWDEEYSDEDYANLDLPVPDWHLAILEERMARYKSEDVTKWRSWEEVYEELMHKISEEIKTRKN
jgi:hypothetical protein